MKSTLKLFHDLEYCARKVGVTQSSHPLCVSRSHFPSSRHTCDLQGIPRSQTLLTRSPHALRVFEHSSDGTPLKKKIAIEPQIEKKYKQV